MKYFSITENLNLNFFYKRKIIFDSEENRCEKNALNSFWDGWFPNSKLSFNS